MRSRKTTITKKMKGGRRDRVWRHGDRKNMHCGRCGGHVDGVLTREGPKWVFVCDGGHHVFKTTVRDRDELLKEGLLSKVPEDPRYLARRRRISEDAKAALESRVYGAQFKEVGHHPFI